MGVVEEHVVSKAIIVHAHTGMVEDAELPYSDVTHSDPPSMEEMREIVCTQQHRPLIPDQWNRDEVRVRSSITHASTRHIGHLTWCPLPITPTPYLLVTCFHPYLFSTPLRSLSSIPPSPSLIPIPHSTPTHTYTIIESASDPTHNHRMLAPGQYCETNSTASEKDTRKTQFLYKTHCR